MPRRTLTAAAVVLALAGCSSGGSSKVGDAVNLTGPNGEKVAVTVDSVVDPTDPGDRAVNGATPEPGTRFVSFQYELVNNGAGLYVDSPETALLIDTAGKSYQPTLVQPEVISNVAQGASSTGNSIPVGDTGLDVEVFQVPTGVKIAAVQLFMDSGAGKSAKWTVG